jgi:7-carboxy-7-deazaguanine synthase
MKAYLPVVEIFSSIQGEGINTGVAATFIRIAGCNLSCPFCDTEYTKSTVMEVSEIVDKVVVLGMKFIVITGGEPLLQDHLYFLVGKLRDRILDVIIEVETNGTVARTPYLGGYIDFISLSPKVPRNQISIHECSSLKILYPYLPGVTAAGFSDFPADEYFIQPIDPNFSGVNKIFEPDNLSPAIEEVVRLGYAWRLGVQLHKMIGVK